MSKKHNNYPGQKIDNWELISLEKTEKRHTYWLCRCVCGKTYNVSATSLNTGKSKQCRECRRGEMWKGYEGISVSLWSEIYYAAHQRKMPMQISIEYAWNLYIKQDRKCVLTKIPIDFYKTHKGKKTRTASLDRIDSKIGYIEGNVQWLHRIVNQMKWDLEQKDFICMCKKIVENNP